MEKIGCGQGAPVMKKGKKKQAKDEIDRQKQAEKKKRRLEKALATSAAIRSELEKKKQKKIEEQLRLDQEGAAIAESVALHVLGEDKDESCPVMLSKNRKCTSWEHSNDTGVSKGYQNTGKHSSGGIGWSAGDYEPSCKRNNWGINHALPRGVHLRSFQAPYYEETSQEVDLSVGLIAAQAVSSLQIAESSGEEMFTGHRARAVVFNRMLGCSSLGNEINFYEF